MTDYDMATELETTNALLRDIRASIRWLCWVVWATISLGLLATIMYNVFGVFRP